MNLLNIRAGRRTESSIAASISYMSQRSKVELFCLEAKQRRKGKMQHPSHTQSESKLQMGKSEMNVATLKTWLEWPNLAILQHIADLVIAKSLKGTKYHVDVLRMNGNILLPDQQACWKLSRISKDKVSVHLVMQKYLNTCPIHVHYWWSKAPNFNKSRHNIWKRHNPSLWFKIKVCIKRRDKTY